MPWKARHFVEIPRTTTTWRTGLGRGASYHAFGVSLVSPRILSDDGVTVFSLLGFGGPGPNFNLKLQASGKPNGGTHIEIRIFLHMSRSYAAEGLDN